MCSKVLNGHIILTDTSITTILAPEMTYTPKYGYTQGLFVAFRGGKCSALSLAAEEERHEGEALKNGAGLLANPRIGARFER